MNHQIHHRYTGAVLHDCTVSDDDPNPVMTTVLDAVCRGVPLANAFLIGANLADADFTGTCLTHANLTRADLTGAKLTGAKLTGAKLSGARLPHADLTDADLTEVDLTEVDLTDADLTDAKLTRADLTGANLTGTKLTKRDGAVFGYMPDDVEDCLADVCAVLDAAPREASGVLAAVREGRIDGTLYDGTCACLIGTIATLRGCAYNALGQGLRPDAERPAERLFLNIHPGHIPELNPVARLVERTIVAWLAASEQEAHRGI